MGVAIMIGASLPARRYTRTAPEEDYSGENKKFDSEAISAMMLLNVNKGPETYLGTKIDDAVVTVSAAFNEYQPQATQDAGAIPGFNDLRIVKEQSVAAVADGVDFFRPANVKPTSDALAWAKLKDTSCVRHAGFRAPLQQGGDTCYLSAALQF